jgi:hypothetical protein
MKEERDDEEDEQGPQHREGGGLLLVGLWCGVVWCVLYAWADQ